MSWEGAPWAPRRWQAEALPIVVDAMAAGRRGVVVACTGAGKSPFLAELVRELQLRELVGPRAGAVVVTTPTQRLVGQLGGTLRARLGEETVGLYYADAKEAHRPVVVACNASARALSAELGGGVDAWIADEAHRSEAAGLQEAQEALAPRLVLGLTATPFRANARERLSAFSEVLYRYTLVQAVRDGVVVPWRVVPWVGRERGAVDEILLEMIERHATGYGFVNARNIKEAEQRALWLTLHGVPAAAVHSRLSDAEQGRRLDALRQGWLRCVVYPSLLQEGFDDPGASWLALARPVKSRVRFIQEFGRVLRTAPGKTEAVILDPHGLTERFDLLTAEALGAGDDDLGNGADEAEGGEGDAGRGAAEGSAEPWRPLEIQPLDALTQWAAHLVQAAQVDGFLPLRFRWSESRRATLASPGQVGALRKMRGLGRYLPPGHAELAERVCLGGHVPSAGAAGDLLDVLGALGKRRERTRWTPRLPVWLPDLGDVDLGAIMDVGDLAAHGLVWAGFRVLVVTQGRRTLLSEVREAIEGDTSAAAGVEAAIRAMALRPGVPLHLSDTVVARLLKGEIGAHRPDVVAALSRRPTSLPVLVTETAKTAAHGLAFRCAAREAARVQKPGNERRRR